MRLRLDPRPFATTPTAVEGGRYRPVSFWQTTVDVEPGEPLAADTSCDVAIVGGGYTGLSTARELLRVAPDLDVVVLERAVIGHGASGRNGGFVMPLLGWNLAYTARKLGRERATAAYRAMYAAIDACLAMVRDDGIDCDLEETGYLLLSCSAARRRHVEEEAALGCELGFGYELLEGDALREHVKSRAFLTGCWDPHTAILNPAKLARGMKRSVERLGARVYEQTQLLELSGGDPVVLRTPRATVRARTAVLAVNGYGAALGLMPSRVLPVHTFIVLTEPVSRESLEEIGWAERRTSLETSRNFIHYFRLTSDDRILFGGEDATLYWGSRHLDEDARVFARLEARFREYFPELARVRISHRWGGVLGVTLDMFPTFGAEGNVLFGGGYSGHGVSLGASAGRILAPEILARLGRDGGSSAAAAPLPFGRRPPPLPPDPLRFAGMQAYRWALHAHDRWQET